MGLFILICWALLKLALIVLAVYVVVWILGKLGFVIPANILQVIWAIIIIFAIIWLVSSSGISAKIT